MNDNDSEIMSGILDKKGLRRIENEQEADVVLVNTCVVRDGAEERAIGRLNSLRTIKKQRPGMIVGVTGCMAQKDQSTIRDRAPYVDLVVGTGQLAQIPSLIETIRATGQPQASAAHG